MSHTPDPHDGGQPELLEQGGGRPLDRDRPGRRRKVLVPVLAGLGLAAVGGAAFGARWFLDEGAQAAEALPASAVGYVGLTLDPSGSQKLEALRTLEKFPLIAEELGLDEALERRPHLDAVALVVDLGAGDAEDAGVLGQVALEVAVVERGQQLAQREVAGAAEHGEVAYGGHGGRDVDRGVHGSTVAGLLDRYKHSFASF